MEADYREEIRKLAARLPTASARNTREWSKVATPIRERAFFSATVENAKFLERTRGFLLDSLAAETEEVVGPDGITRTALKAGGKARFIEQARKFMAASGMAGEAQFREAQASDIRNIGGADRLALIFDTQVLTSFGYADWAQGMEPEVLAAYPAARFVRESPVIEPRPRHAMTTGDVRLKNDFEYWANFQNDPEIGGFGVPWGPYGFNSGMGQEDVSRREAVRLGLMGSGDAVEIPDTTDYGSDLSRQYNANVSASEPVSEDIKLELRRKLAEKFGPSVLQEDGKLSIDPLRIGRQLATQAARNIIIQRYKAALEAGADVSDFLLEHPWLADIEI